MIDQGPTSESAVLIAGRYRLDEHVARGAHGEVWRARDTTTGNVVAVKLLLRDIARTRREVGVLRLLRIPGVVRLLDDGFDDDRVFLAMEWIDGHHFPGRGELRGWAELAPLALGLLEIIGQVHAAGIVHRDLKPANVLVAADGRVTLLDFSISHFTEQKRNDITADGQWHGTPGYLAPEQMLGDPATVAADLYAIGVMMFEALTGDLPHTTLKERLIGPPPLREQSSSPSNVVDTIRRMLAPEPAHRPKSAREVVDALTGSGEQAFGPWLGSREWVENATDTLLLGQALDVVSAPGTGRTRFVAEIELALRAKERVVRRLVPSSEPFGSLATVFEPLKLEPSTSLGDARAAATSAAIAGLHQIIVLADDYCLMDEQSRTVLDHLGPNVPLLRVTRRPADDRLTITLPSLAVGDLTPLFVGTERVLQEKSRAARHLLQRSDGIPGRVFAELRGWVSAGIAVPNGELFALRSDGLDRLDSGLSVSEGVQLSTAAWAGLSHGARELAGWIALAGSLPLQTARDLTGFTQWQIEAFASELAGLDAIRLQSAILESKGAIQLTIAWPAERIETARRGLVEALPHGSPERLRHMLLDTSTDAAHLVDECLAVLPRLVDNGQWGAGAVVLEEAARTLRERDENRDLPRQRAVFRAWVELACVDPAPAAVDRALSALKRVDCNDSELSALAELATAALEVATDPPRALQRLEQLHSFGSAALERCRASLRLIAARSMPVEVEREVLQSVTAWAERADDETTARLFGWRGRLAYREGDFPGAADLHLRCSKHHPRRFEQIAARLNAASAMLEAFMHDEARRHALSAKEQLTTLQHPNLLLRCEWLIRAADYRLCRQLAPDLELLSVAQQLNYSSMVPLIQLTEAAIAWRLGDLPLAGSLAEGAYQRWRQLQSHDELALMSRCFAAACGHRYGPSTFDELATALSSFQAPEIALQAGAFLVLCNPGLAPALQETTRRCYSQMNPAQRGKRLDIISADEALIVLRGSQLPQGPPPGPGRPVPAH